MSLCRKSQARIPRPLRFILVQASVALWMPGSAAAVIAETRPCTTPGRACQEKVPLGPAERYSLVYRSFSLEQANEGITRAVIVIHGAGRNADTYFASVVAGALIAGALDSTLIVSPRFAAASGSDCRDTLDSGEISWTCGGRKTGGAAARPRACQMFTPSI